MYVLYVLLNVNYININILIYIILQNSGILI